ncbi:MAG TPA: 50S ribosomal protein L29 [Acidimicrobiia bacterium]|nr:50S ribosomal protein L29 [Acidimicrobiia bacterium]
MYATEIRQLNDAELVTKFLDLKEELFTMRFQLATGSLEKHNLIPRLKKDIARVQTVLNERDITASATTDADGDKS